ncbi:hypothetical protein AOLI_G00115140 [Acnodon oligacanthus]
MLALNNQHRLYHKDTIYYIVYDSGMVFYNVFLILKRTCFLWCTRESEMKQTNKKTSVSFPPGSLLAVSATPGGFVLF